MRRGVPPGAALVPPPAALNFRVRALGHHSFSSMIVFARDLRLRGCKSAASVGTVPSQSRATTAENQQSHKPRLKRRARPMKIKLTVMLLTLTGLMILAGQL